MPQRLNAGHAFLGLLKLACVGLSLLILLPSNDQAQQPVGPELKALIEKFKNSHETDQARLQAKEAILATKPTAMMKVLDGSTLLDVFTHVLQDTDDHPKVRDGAIGAISRLFSADENADAKDTIALFAVPALFSVFEESGTGELSATAGFAIATIAHEVNDLPDLKSHLPFVIGALDDKAWCYIGALDDNARCPRCHAAVTILNEVGAKAKDDPGKLIDKLIDLVRDSKVLGWVREAAVTAISNISDAKPTDDTKSSEVAQTLTKLLNEPTAESGLQEKAASQLGRMGARAKNAVPILLGILKNAEKVSVRAAAARALGKIGKEPKVDGLKGIISSLLDVLNNKREDNELRRDAAYGLVSLGSDARSTVPTLVEILKDPTEDPSVRQSVMYVLEVVGPSAQEALPSLVAALADPNLTPISDEQTVLKTIGEIARNLKEAKETKALPQLRKAQQAIIKKTQKPQSVLKEAIEALEGMYLRMFVDWMLAYKAVSGVALYLFLTLSFYLILLWLRPLWILRINEAINKWAQSIALPANVLVLMIRVVNVATVMVFQYHRRVLDAWVAKYLDQARQSFEQSKTVEDRQICVDLPVEIETDRTEELDRLQPKDLRPTLAKKCSILLIHGEGGCGKTTLACQAGKWAMEADRGARLCEDHLMIPVLIDADLELTDEKGPQALTSAIRGKLQRMIDAEEPPSEELIEHLLRRRRLLVIVDHLSEMNEATRSLIRPGRPDFPVNALVVTSRHEEGLDGAPKTIVRPQRMDRKRLSAFMDDYLKARQKQDLFEGQEFFDYCGRLLATVGKDRVTVLLTKLYADQVISAKEGGALDELPENIPALMLCYLNELNQGITDDPLSKEDVHHAAEVIAWECLKEKYQPGQARRDAVIKALGREPDPERVLDYLERRLSLIKRDHLAGNKISFDLHPLAEYLAGLHLVKHYGERDDLWQKFFAQMPGAPQTIQGFLLAVRDCCRANHLPTRVPAFVLSELDRLTEQVSSASAAGASSYSLQEK